MPVDVRSIRYTPKQWMDLACARPLWRMTRGKLVVEGYDLSGFLSALEQGIPFVPSPEERREFCDLLAQSNNDQLMTMIINQQVLLLKPSGALWNFHDLLSIFERDTTFQVASKQINVLRWALLIPMPTEKCKKTLIEFFQRTFGGAMRLPAVSNDETYAEREERLRAQYKLQVEVIRYYYHSPVFVALALDQLVKDAGDSGSYAVKLAQDMGYDPLQPLHDLVYTRILDCCFRATPMRRKSFLSAARAYEEAYRLEAHDQLKAWFRETHASEEATRVYCDLFPEDVYSITYQLGAMAFNA